MPKAKQATEPIVTDEVILYNSKETQHVVLNLDKNGKTYRIVHKLQALDFARYFQFQSTEQSTITKLKRISTAMAEPIYRLWFELCEGVEGYVFHDKADWKSRVHRNDAMAAISGILFVQVLDDTEIEADEAETEELYDDEKPTKIVFRAMYSGALVTLTHHFREMSKAEADEFLAISTNQPNDAQQASAVKQSEAEKLYNLGKRMLVSADGYAEGSDVPPWHLSATVKTHCIRESERAGKFLTPSHLMLGG
jgi:hypothetical protein